MGRSRWPGASVEDDKPPANPDEMARGIVLRRLEAAPRTRFELAETLRERSVPEAVASQVLDRFEEVGLIDDSSFAAMWVESRQRTRHLSRRALGNELRRKGVASERITAALDSVDAEDEWSAARLVAERKARSVAGLPRQTQYRRVAGALARKGYGGAISAEVVRDVLSALDADELDTDGEGQP